MRIDELIIFLKLQESLNGRKRNNLVIYWPENEWNVLTSFMETHGFSFKQGNRFYNCQHEKL